MFILRAIIPVYWRYVNTWLCQVDSFFSSGKSRATATEPEVYKNHHWDTLSAPSLMHNLDPACTAWKENEREKKTVSTLCNHSAQKWSGCASELFCRDFCQKLHFTGQACTCALPFLFHPGYGFHYLNTKKKKNDFVMRAEYCRLSQRFPPSVLSMYLKKKKKKMFKMSNWKFRIYVNRKKKKNLAVRFTQTGSGELVCTGKHPLPSPIPPARDPLNHMPLKYWASVHRCWWYLHHLFPHACAAGSPVSVYKQSGSRYRTPRLFWLPLPMQSVRSPCWSQQTKVSGLHSSSFLAFCPRVQVV